jgi:hypothetical protein
VYERSYSLGRSICVCGAYFKIGFLKNSFEATQKRGISNNLCNDYNHGNLKILKSFDVTSNAFIKDPRKTPSSQM